MTAAVITAINIVTIISILVTIYDAIFRLTNGLHDAL